MSPVRSRRDAFAQALHRFGIAAVGRVVGDACEQRCERGFVALGGRHVAAHGVGDVVAERRVVQLAARGAEDAQLGREQPGVLEAVQRRQQHPLREVAGGAEDDEQRSAVAGHAT